VGEGARILLIKANSPKPSNGFFFEGCVIMFNETRIQGQ